MSGCNEGRVCQGVGVPQNIVESHVLYCVPFTQNVLDMPAQLAS